MNDETKPFFLAENDDLPPKQIVISLGDPRARGALNLLAFSYRDENPKLSQEIYDRLESKEELNHASDTSDEGTIQGELP